MAQWLRALAALPEDQGLILSIHMRITTHSQPAVTPVSGDPIPFSDLHRYQAGTWYTDMQAGKR